MKFIIETTKHQEAYLCENGHFIPKYKRRGACRPATDSLSLHNCCPECGEIKIQKVTGIWERKYQVIGLLFKKEKLIEEKFIESIFSFHYRKEIKK